MKHHRFLVSFVMFAVFTLCLTVGMAEVPAELRTWTDNTGKHQIEAELVEVDKGTAVLKTTDGEEKRVPLSKLSTNDRRWIREYRKDAGQRSADDSTGDSAQMENASSVAGTDWPRWRGINNDGISTETGLLESWPDNGPPLLWTAEDFGQGMSSVTIYDGKLYTMGLKDGQTKLICRNVNDGTPLWEANVGGGDKPNCTPTVDPESKLVFGLSHDGDLLCANAETGDEVWRKNFGSDFGGRMMSQWGYSESPLVDGEKLICTPGGDKACVVALNKMTGRPIWACPMQDGKAGYSSPVISNGGGIKQYITLVGPGLISVAADDGRPLWHYPRIANSTANVPTALIQGDYVFASTGYNDGGSALLKLNSKGRNGVAFEELYYFKSKEIQNHHGGMVLIDGHVYMGHGHNNGLPVCLNLRTGKPTWGPVRGPGSESAAIVAADGHLYFRYENGIMALIEATPKDYNLKGSFKIKTRNGKSWPHPVISDKKLYLRDQYQLHCYDISAG